MGKKPIVSVTYENEKISIKNSLPYLKCVVGFYVNGFLSMSKFRCMSVLCRFDILCIS